MTSTYIYKIAPSLPKPIFAKDKHAGDSTSQPILPPSSLDVSSNFIHMSTAAQVPGTLKHFFPTTVDEDNIIYLLKVRLQPLESAGSIKWESPDAKICGLRDGEGMFPHLYFDDPVAADGGMSRRLWLKGGQVEDVVEVVSKVGGIGWEGELKELEDWLV